jgi:hypothetical protein
VTDDTNRERTKKHVRTIWTLRRLLRFNGMTDAEIDRAIQLDHRHPEDPAGGWDDYLDSGQEIP